MAENENIHEYIASAAKEKYKVLTKENERYLLELAPKAILEKSIVSLTRKGSNKSTCKTLLAAKVKSLEDISAAYKWAAEVRADLTEPEASDLYLIIEALEPLSSVDVSISVEVNESFCRKYFKRPGESIEQLLSRTFLGDFTNEIIGMELSDPLLAALAETGKEKNWFTENSQKKWYEAFLSGKTGAELIDVLLS